MQWMERRGDHSNAAVAMAEGGHWNGGFCRRVSMGHERE